MHIAAFVGDSSGNQAYSSGDTTLLQRIIVGSGTGPVAYQLADPMLLMDINRGGTITSGDATLMQRVIVGTSVTQVPPVPTGATPPASGGPDPRLFISTDLTGAAGSTVTVPVNMLVTEPSGITVSGMDLAIQYDDSKFTVGNFRVGSLLGSGFAFSTNTATPGIIRITLSKDSGPTLALNEVGPVFEFDLTVLASAANGGSVINLLQNFSTTITQVTDNDINELTLVPAPTNADSDSVDGFFTIDNTAPATTSFTWQTPATSPTNADVLVFRATFSETVTGLDATDFAVTGTTATVTGVSAVSGTVYDVTVSGGNLASLNATVGLDFAGTITVTDLAGNALPNTEPSTDETYLVDNTAPAATSFTRQTPMTSPTNADVLVFRATFSEAVTGLDAADFAVTGTTATVTAVSAVSGTVYDVTVSGGNLASLNATVGLDFAGTVTVTDLAGNVLPNTEPGTDETYLVDNTAPATMSFTRQTPLTSPTNADVLVFRATFSEAVTGLDAADFAVTGTTATITAVSAVSGTVYDVTVSGGNLASLNATVGLDFAGTVTITDLAGNALPATEPVTDETYLVDNLAPVTTSFTRQIPATSPTNADTLVFRATFNEAVTGLDAADFAISGTTATVTNVSAVSGTVYDVTVSGGNLASLNATVGLDFAGTVTVTDLAGNALPTTEPGTDETYLVDNTAPATTSFTRQTPLTSPTNADVLVFRATFSEAVTGLDAADFAVTGTTATITAVSAVGGYGL